MRTINLTIDLRSFLLGALTLGSLLLLTNAKPAPNSQPDPGLLDTRRFQMLTDEKRTVILDTKTGRFLLDPFATIKPKWVIGDFEELQKRETK